MLSKYYKIKISCLFSLVIGMLLSTPCQSQIDTKQKQSELISLDALDAVPLFSNCDSSASKNLQKDCFSKNINHIVLKNFDLTLGKKLNLSGIVKIFSRFTINKEGKIVDIKVRAQDPKLKEETLRIINLIPQLKPGKKDGKHVSVLYNLPIQFKIQE